MSEHFEQFFSAAGSENLSANERSEGLQALRAFMGDMRFDDADVAAFFAPALSLTLSAAERKASWAPVQTAATVPVPHPAHEAELEAFFAPAASVFLSAGKKKAVLASVLPQELPIPMSVKEFTFSRFRSFFSFSSFGWAVPGLAAVLLLGAGFSYAEQALPGDFLYPLKRVDEQIRQTLTFSKESKAETDAQVMDTRLDEAQTLQARASFNQSASAVLDKDFRVERRQALAHIQDLQSSGDLEMANKLRARLNAAADRYHRLFQGQKLDDEMVAAASSSSSSEASSQVAAPVRTAAKVSASSSLGMMAASRVADDASSGSSESQAQESSSTAVATSDDQKHPIATMGVNAAASASAAAPGLLHGDDSAVSSH